MSGNCGKYTEQELRERGVDKIIHNGDPKMVTKLSTYNDEGVKTVFWAIKRGMKAILTNVEGYDYPEMAHQVATVMIDTFLLKRCKGLTPVLPEPLVPKNSLQPVTVGPAVGGGAFQATAKKTDFTNWDGKIDTIKDINWIYNNLYVADVKPNDAPSPGAWAHLQYHRSSPDAMQEFFTKVYPRLIPAKSVIERMAEKLHDDGRTTFDLLNRLLKEDEDGTGQVPILSVVLPERPGLQDQAGQSEIPQTNPQTRS